MKKILVAQFKHETNSFSPGCTDRAAYEARNALLGEEAIRTRFAGARNETCGLLDYFADKEEFTLIPVLAFDAMPGAPVEETVFREVESRLLQALDTPVDGILLSLHGAMVTTHYQDGEGALLESIRQKVGKDIPIMVTLDLHANITEKMAKNATALFVCDYYPHTDMYETGLRAAACMERTLLGQISPVMVWRQLPMIMACTSTLDGVMKRLTGLAQTLRQRPGVLSCNLAHGFFRANIYDEGISVVAVADGDAGLAAATARELATAVWNAREELKYEPLDADGAIDAALASDRFPVVLADVADNPGGGGTGDAVYFLKRLIERNVQDAVMGAIYDPETTEQAVCAGVGATIPVRIGGKVDPAVTGGPVEAMAYVKAITDGKYRNSGPMFHGLRMDHGKIAVLVIGGVTAMVSTVRAQAWDLELYRSCGILPERQKIIVPKSAVHYRASYSEVADVMLSVETPAAASQKLDTFVLDRCRRPVYPLDEVEYEA